MQTREVQNEDFFGVRTFIVSNFKVFASPRIISPMFPIYKGPKIAF